MLYDTFVFEHHGAIVAPLIRRRQTSWERNTFYYIIVQYEWRKHWLLHVEYMLQVSVKYVYRFTLQCKSVNTFDKSFRELFLLKHFRLSVDSYPPRGLFSVWAFVRLGLAFVPVGLSE